MTFANPLAPLELGSIRVNSRLDLLLSSCFDGPWGKVENLDRIPNTGLNSRPTSKTSVVGVEKFHMKRSCRA
jgi:hypothetical protein